jgi:hypothetical protein
VTAAPIAGYPLQYRPQAVVKTGSVHVMADALLANLRSVGWESPILMFRGGHLASAGPGGRCRRAREWERHHQRRRARALRRGAAKVGPIPAMSGS